MDALTPEFVSTVQHRGGTQIPEKVRRSLKLEEGDKIYWNVIDKGLCYIHKVLVEVRKE